MLHLLRIGTLICTLLLIQSSCTQTNNASSGWETAWDDPNAMTSETMDNAYRNEILPLQEPYLFAEPSDRYAYTSSDVQTDAQGELFTQNSAEWTYPMYSDNSAYDQIYLSLYSPTSRSFSETPWEPVQTQSFSEQNILPASELNVSSNAETQQPKDINSLWALVRTEDVSTPSVFSPNGFGSSPSNTDYFSLWSNTQSELDLNMPFMTKAINNDNSVTEPPFLHPNELTVISKATEQKSLVETPWEPISENQKPIEPNFNATQTITFAEPPASSEASEMPTPSSTHSANLVTTISAPRANWETPWESITEQSSNSHPVVTPSTTTASATRAGWETPWESIPEQNDNTYMAINTPSKPSHSPEITWQPLVEQNINTQAVVTETPRVSSKPRSAWETPWEGSELATAAPIKSQEQPMQLAMPEKPHSPFVWDPSQIEWKNPEPSPAIARTPELTIPLQKPIVTGSEVAHLDSHAPTWENWWNGSQQQYEQNQPWDTRWDDSYERQQKPIPPQQNDEQFDYQEHHYPVPAPSNEYWHPQQEQYLSQQSQGFPVSQQSNLIAFEPTHLTPPAQMQSLPVNAPTQTEPTYMPPQPMQQEFHPTTEYMTGTPPQFMSQQPPTEYMTGTPSQFMPQQPQWDMPQVPVENVWTDPIKQQAPSTQSYDMAFNPQEPLYMEPYADMPQMTYSPQGPQEDMYGQTYSQPQLVSRNPLQWDQSQTPMAYAPDANAQSTENAEQPQWLQWGFSDFEQQPTAWECDDTGLVLGRSYQETQDAFRAGGIDSEECPQACHSQERCYQLCCYYEPVYTQTRRLVEIPQPCKVPRWRHTPRYYEVKRTRFVPQVFSEVKVRYETESYQTEENRMVKKWICEPSCDPCAPKQWRAIEVPEFYTQTRWRDVPRYETVERTRYVPQFNTEMAVCYESEFYETEEFVCVKQWVYETQCKFVQKQYYKRICQDSCCPIVCKK